MKITKIKLKQIIKEEIENLLDEVYDTPTETARAPQNQIGEEEEQLEEQSPIGNLPGQKRTYGKKGDWNDLMRALGGKDPDALRRQAIKAGGTDLAGMVRDRKTKPAPNTRGAAGAKVAPKVKKVQSPEEDLYGAKPKFSDLSKLKKSRPVAKTPAKRQPGSK